MKKAIVSVLIGLSLLGVGCSSTTAAVSDNTKKNVNTTNQEKTFTITELSKYNGQNGNPAYVAVDGVVYDVTNIKEWKNGTHKNGITAGKDLSDVIKQSPHGKDVLNKLTAVGKLK